MIEAVCSALPPLFLSGSVRPRGFPAASRWSGAAAQLRWEDRWQKSIDRGLDWLKSRQNRLGGWDHKSYPVAVSALAAMALTCSGSTTTQGPHAQSIRNAVDFLISKSRKNGLIGDPRRDQRYTYGHGFAMLFLSQVLGEEEDIDRRTELIEVLDRAVGFSVSAQTKAGGWGYVSGKESDFDEGSTTITQVQGLRGCRNAGIVVPQKAIEDAKKYIYRCQNSDGGISYSTTTIGSSRPAITAAALAALYNAGEYEGKVVDLMWAYCKKRLHRIEADEYGHWHYAYLYYTQVVYRQPDELWQPYRNRLNQRLADSQTAQGFWEESSVGAVYATSVNLIVMQMDFGYLPIFQK
ncbi:MAG: prenyltransferase/squalene oxidase repeat-containing protein [Planctomycetota bacterium]